jgi:hypothetical protein
MPSITSGGNLPPSLLLSKVVAKSCCWDVFSSRDWETSQEQGKDECSKVQSDPWLKPAPEHSGPQTGVKVHLQIGQRPKAHSQDNAGVASGQVSEYIHYHSKVRGHLEMFVFERKAHFCPLKWHQTDQKYSINILNASQSHLFTVDVDTGVLQVLFNEDAS